MFEFLDGILDSEIYTSPSYWILTIGSIIALFIGFKSATLWSNGGIGLMNQIIIIAAMPVIAYFVIMFMRNR